MLAPEDDDRAAPPARTMAPTAHALPRPARRAWLAGAGLALLLGAGCAASHAAENKPADTPPPLPAAKAPVAEVTVTARPEASTAPASNPAGIVALASGLSKPGCLVLDATHAYWANTGKGSIMKVPIAGGTPTLLATGQKGLESMAVDRTHLYWTDRATNMGDGTVMKLPLAGGAPVQLVGGQQYPSSIAVDATHVYWSNYNSGAILRAPLAGGEPEELVTEVDAHPKDLKIDATRAYWTNEGVRDIPGSTLVAPLGGGDAKKLAGARDGSSTLALDRTHAYLASQRNGTIARVPLQGGAPTVLAQGQRAPMDIAVGAAFVYWTNVDGGTVMKVPLAGGAPVVVASGQDQPWSIAVDASRVYWTNRSHPNGVVMSAPR
jgi:hypothetical protein